jgi:hypothetical protein
MRRCHCCPAVPSCCVASLDCCTRAVELGGGACRRHAVPAGCVCRPAACD